MQLDHARIAVRERSLTDTLDLALHVIRRYASPLMVSTALGILPLLFLNQLLLGWIMNFEYRAAYFWIDDAGSIMRFLWDMTLLIFIEAPLASVFATTFLGRAVFEERPGIREVIREVTRRFSALLICQGIIRGIVPVWLLLATLDRYGDFNGFSEGFLLPLLACYSGCLRAFRPYLNEIILLERNPLRAPRASEMTIGRRSGLLHGPSAGESLNRAIGMGLISVPLTIAIFGLFLFCSGVLLNYWSPGPLMVQIGYPLALWTVAGFLGVVRFLNYLNLRIRQEGWEVELRLRAEASRLTGKLT